MRSGDFFGCVSTWFSYVFSLTCSLTEAVQALRVCRSSRPYCHMAVWFHTANFAYSYAPSEDMVVRAYCAQFRRVSARNSATTERLCMLHTDWVECFPYRGALARAIAEEFSTFNGLELVGEVSYGFVSRGDSWVRFSCCSPYWNGWYCYRCGTQR